MSLLFQGSFKSLSASGLCWRFATRAACTLETLKAPSRHRLIDTLIPEEQHIAGKTMSQFESRSVRKSHFTYCFPEPSIAPKLIAVSPSCVTALGLHTKEINRPLFLEIFSGNKLLPIFERPYATVYGAHAYGQWYGQRGDGRAMSLGQIETDNAGSYELQLKGIGRTPFSRQFDGRAVVRSSIREYLASEAMHHLGISTTRALCVVRTGEVNIARAWYTESSTAAQQQQDSSSSSKGAGVGGPDHKYNPHRVVKEPGAILTRLSQNTFTRIGQFEHFAKNNEWTELALLADYVCQWEFPTLLLEENLVERYLKLFENVCRANAELVCGWMRVGYTQGNMNSDNVCLAGRTLDYGPFGWLEQFNMKYQPWTGDEVGMYCFGNQPQAMGVNAVVLADSFQFLIDPLLSADASHSFPSSGGIESCRERLHDIAVTHYEEYFQTLYQGMKLQKLGLLPCAESWGQDMPSEDAIAYGRKIDALWYDLTTLLTRSKCDYTVFFRELSNLVPLEYPSGSSCNPEYAQQDISVITSEFSSHECRALNILCRSVAEPFFITQCAPGWIEWYERYVSLIQENIMSSGQDPHTYLENRKTKMNEVNPKFVLRNWMASLAYEQEQQHFDEGKHYDPFKNQTLVDELTTLLSNPYSEQSSEMTSKWYQSHVPSWARSLPGVSFMS